MNRLAAAILSIFAVFAMFAASPASASGRQLAIGAAGGVILPEGARMIPVYTWPRGTRWDPADVGETYSFREPIYTTPRGYRYVYVRGYQIIRARKASAFKHRVHRVKSASVVRAKKIRHEPCVTDIGNGRYEFCR
jgi:hypothetical protein